MATPGVPTPLRDEPLLAARAPCLTRERKQAREHDAELDKLTVSARTAVVLAKKLTASELQDFVDALLREAKAGKTQAAKLVLELVKLAQSTPDFDPSAPEGVSLRDLTPEQRAAAMGRVERELAEWAAALDAAGEQGIDETPPTPWYHPRAAWSPHRARRTVAPKTKERNRRRGYARADFEEAWRRYLPRPSQDGGQSVPTVPSVETSGQIERHGTLGRDNPPSQQEETGDGMPDESVRAKLEQKLGGRDSNVPPFLRRR